MTQHEPAAHSGFETAAHELAAATATLVQEHDVVGTLTQLLAGCARSVNADAAGLLVRNGDSAELELLASTSHRASELELYQLHSDQGPCIEAANTGEAVSAYSSDLIAASWPALVDVCAKNRFTGTHATPLRWHGRRLGAIGLFFVTPPQVDEQEVTDAIAKAFSDVATLTVVHSSDLSVEQLLAQTQAALSDRVVIERAKGVLAYIHEITMDAAFDRLQAIAQRERRTITHIATQLVARAAGSEAIG